jgi:hypothetical protein
MSHLLEVMDLPVPVEHLDSRNFDVSSNVLNVDALSTLIPYYPRELTEGLKQTWAAALELAAPERG